MSEHDDDGCPECGAPVAVGLTSACTHCGYQLRLLRPTPAAPPAYDPAESGDLSAAALTVEHLQEWYDQQPPARTGGQDAHPDAADTGEAWWTDYQAPTQRAAW